MSEFTYLFRGRQTAASPEQQQKHIQKWAAWFKELGAKGHISNPGHPLEASGKVVNGNQKIVKDGPYAEAKDVVGGVAMSEPLLVRRGHPHHSNSCRLSGAERVSPVVQTTEHYLGCKQRLKNAVNDCIGIEPVGDRVGS
jgi:hypothetical protein